MRLISLKPEQFKQFVNIRKDRSYYQTTEYANLMANLGYKVQYIGIITDTKRLIGATILLYKEAFMNYRVAYAPRGILFDYEKTDLVQDMVEVLKKTLKKQNIMFLRMDPYIPITSRDKDGNIINFNNQTDLIMANLQSAGFNYKMPSVIGVIVHVFAIKSARVALRIFFIGGDSLDTVNVAVGLHMPRAVISHTVTSNS